MRKEEQPIVERVRSIARRRGFADADLCNQMVVAFEYLQRLRDEEHAIVARIWKQLGNPTYEELAGRSIYDLIDELKARATTAESEASALRKRVEELESALRPFGRRSTRDRSAVEMVGACGLRLTHFDRARTLTEGGNNAG